MQKSFLLSFALAFPALGLAQETPSTGAQTSEIAFYREFGAPGATGSFRAKLSRAGAGVVFVQATDHYVTLQAARKQTHGPDDWLLLATNGADHALRLVGEAGSAMFPVEPSTATWTAADVDGGVRFTLDSTTGLVLEKTLRHDAKGRGFVLEIVLRNVSSPAVGKLPLQLLGPALVLPAEASLFGTVAVSIAAPIEGDPVFVSPKVGTIQSLAVDPRALSFAGSTNRFFAAFLWPQDDAARAALTKFEVDTVPWIDDVDSHTKAGTVTRMRYGMELAVPSVGSETRAAFGLYLGPKSYRVFETLPEPARFAPILDVDLNPPCCGVDVPGGRMMAKLLLKLLGWFHDLIGNWGVAIVMLTILVRGLMAPLNFRMQKSMRAYSARMAKLKPKLDELKTKHGDDQKAYQQAMIALQREHKLMPPIGGCAPIFLTMPIYIGLFTALRTAYDVRQQPFVGWMDDLSSADALFEIGWSMVPHFNLLPLVWIGMFLWMQTRMPLPTDPQARQMQSIMRYMPILFGVMLYNYASALMVYMVTSMVWSLIESAITKRILGPIDPNVAAMTPTPM